MRAKLAVLATGAPPPPRPPHHSWSRHHRRIPRRRSFKPPRSRLDGGQPSPPPPLPASTSRRRAWPAVSACALRCGVPPGPAPRRNPLPRRPPNLRKRRPRRRHSSHPHPGAAPVRRLLPHRRPAPPVLAPEGAPKKIQGHRDRAEDGHVASRSCSVHRCERGVVQSRGAQQRGGLHPFRRRRVRVAVPRWLLAGLRRHTLPTRRDPIDQIAWVLELSERRRPPSRRGAGELDDDMLLRLHPVPGEPGEVARFMVGIGKRRRRCAGTGRRRSSSVLKNHCAVYHVQLHGSDIHSSLSACIAHCVSRWLLGHAKLLW
ncbi:hypothetical protein PVAP13_2NG333703 [Panicum virgatum]|uniref:Uncharacterized protein n=1 Tax=Panicum virgatum TaxID=38727 RepID=A0A8T0VG77_PANVG|nr:hypothetical protein PVAP13_2NG333703 [Panicum virgatum]